MLPLSGIVVGLFVAYVFVCSRRRWFGKQTPEHILKRHEGKDEIYEEVDLQKMNAENNYWSMGGAIDGNKSGYADLNRDRDAENDYQSLYYK